MFVARAQKIAPILNVLVACLVLATMVVRAADGPTDAGTVISNRAEATYTDDTGSSYEAVTETVQSIQYVAALGYEDVSICPTRIAPYTVIAELAKRGMYAPPSLWTTIDILNEIGSESLARARGMLLLPRARGRRPAPDVDAPAPPIGGTPARAARAGRA